MRSSLFTLLVDRYERQRVVITTNLIFSEWECIFKESMPTPAAIDRVVHLSLVLDLMKVDSYRATTAGRKRDRARSRTTRRRPAGNKSNRRRRKI
jgi:DNA replication protein DnaC